MKLRLFTQQDGFRIAEWMTDPAYFSFFRGNSIIPTIEECANYPTWSQNMVMMISDGEQTIGMAIGYNANWRNRTVKAGVLIDKVIHRHGVGRDALLLWTKQLFSRGFRKVALEFVDDWLYEPLKRLGFVEEGRYISECIGLDGHSIDEIRMACFAEALTEGKKV